MVLPSDVQRVHRNVTVPGRPDTNCCGETASDYAQHREDEQEEGVSLAYRAVCIRNIDLGKIVVDLIRYLGDLLDGAIRDNLKLGHSFRLS